jgi:hypothetical protein
MQVSVVSDLAKLQKGMTRQQREQLPFALSNTLNTIAFAGRLHVQAQLRAKLDRPTPYTLRGVQVEKADKKKALVAKLGFVGKGFRQMKGEIMPADYMTYQIAGGTRHPRKRTIMVPTKHLKTNRFGNVAVSKYRSFLADKARYFAGVPTSGSKGGRKPRLDPEASGVWKRLGPGGNRRKNIQMMIAFEPQAHYKPRFPFNEIVTRHVKRTFQKEFGKAFQKAMKSAR